MAGKAGMIAAGVAGALAIGTGGYFANEWRVCRNMETDFVRSVDGFTSNIEANALAGAVGVEVDHDEQRDLQKWSLKVQQMQLTSIYERCGSDAGRAAADLASDELRESMRQVLSLP